MTQLALQHYLAVGAILFVIGMIGFVTRRNLIVMFLCTELMFQGVAINLVAFGRYLNNDLGGQAFTIFILVIAAAEASLALGLVVLLFRQKNTLDADAWRELKGGFCSTGVSPVSSGLRHGRDARATSEQSMNWVIEHSYLIPLLPLLGAAMAGFFGARWLKGQSHWPIWIGVGIAAVMSITLLIGMLHEVSDESAEPFGRVKDFYMWIEAGS